MPANKRVEDVAWENHPLVPEVKIRKLLTKDASGADLTCLQINVPAGVDIPEHVHETQNDIIYPLSGKAKMYVEGTGEFDLVPGIIVHVPVNVKHRIFDVEEELMIFDVFSPALV